MDASNARDGRGHERGQSTVEYAVVLLAFLALVVALGTVWHAARSGRLLHIAQDAAPHGVRGEGGSGLSEDVLAL